MKTTAIHGKIEPKQGWIECPNDGKKILRVLPTTVAKDLLIYCPKCKQHFVVNIGSVPVP